MKITRLLGLTVGALGICGAPRLSMAADGGATPDAGFDAAVSRDASAGAFDAASRGDGAADGATGDGALPPPRHVVGQACKKDGDCAPGLLCLSSDEDSLGLGGPAGGLCTVDCKTGGQDDCNRVDTGSICASDSSHQFAFCYELCEPGPTSAGEQKCHDRSTMGCYPSPSGTAFCTPMCSRDADCGNGRACDPRTGLCVSSFTEPFTIGTACDPGPPPAGCAGPCTTLGTGAGTTSDSFCTKTCVIGLANACEVDPTASGKPTAACVLRFTQGEGPGDVGECVQLCDCDSDCKNPDFICSPKNAEGTGRAGTCYPKLTFNGITAGLPCDAGEPTHDATPPAAGGASGAGGATAVADAGPDAGSVDLSATGGCNCRFTPAAPRRPEAAIAFLFASLMLRRARRRSRD